MISLPWPVLHLLSDGIVPDSVFALVGAAVHRDLLPLPVELLQDLITV